MKSNISVHIALFLVLLAMISIVVFPILGNAPLSDSETNILALAKLIHGASIKELFSGVFAQDIVTLTYAYVVDILTNLFHGNEKFMVRLPSALSMIILTFSLFRFDGMIEKLNKSFFASMLFLSCGFISMLTFSASVVAIPTIMLIVALICLYHWIRRRSNKYIVLFIISTTLATIQLGTIAPSIVMIMATAFLVSTRLGTLRNSIIVICSIATSLFLTFAWAYILTDNFNHAINIFDINITLLYLTATDNHFAYTFLNYIVFAVFPWSIPLIISAFWAFRKPKMIVAYFLKLKLLQRFGIVLFLLSIPSFFFFTKISLILIVASIFFNMPLVGNYMLSQFDNHTTVWRITGGICATIGGIGVAIFIALNNGIVIELMGHTVSIVNPSWSGWCISIIVAIYISIYTLWRNKRDIARNHRYLYNILVLYLLSEMLFIGFINSNLRIV